MSASAARGPLTGRLTNAVAAARAARLAAGRRNTLARVAGFGGELRPTGRAPVPVPFISAEALQDLPDANPLSLTPAAPIDERPRRATTGIIVHPRAPLPLFSTPGGTPFAQLRPSHPGGETWLPVIGQQLGWVQVLLPGGPAGAAGWLDASRVTGGQTRYDLKIQLGASRLRLLHDGRPAGIWPVSVDSVIPVGRTFLLSAVRRSPAAPPLLLRLAVSAGFRGLVTIHCWPLQRADPNNCASIRVPEHAMTALGVLTPGCLVRIDAR